MADLTGMVGLTTLDSFESSPERILVVDSAQAILSFPCVFPVKAMGRNTDEFEALVVTIVRRHVPYLADTDVTSRCSKDSNYRSVTATFTAHSRAQLDALYQELSDHEQVLMLL